MAKKFTRFRTVIFSRHPSHSPLRKSGELLPFRSVMRLGSTTPSNPRLNRIELNSIESVKISSNKLLMKRKFTEAGVQTANWWTIGAGNVAIPNGVGQQGSAFSDLPFPIIAKHVRGSRGEGNYKLDSLEELNDWMRGKTLSNYIFEEFYSYVREYRLHVSKNGCFYTCRKMLKTDAPEENKWQRHDDNCVWIVEENALFDKPVNWTNIVNDCKNALKAIGADILAFDVKVQSAKKANGSVRQEPKYIIIESNSAPSFGDVTLKKYMEEIPKLLKEKHSLVKLKQLQTIN
jgi:hypothetical protein